MKPSNAMTKTRVKTSINRHRPPAWLVSISIIAALVYGILAVMWWVVIGTNAIANRGGTTSTLSDVQRCEMFYFQDHHRYASLAQLRTEYGSGYSFPSSENDYRFQITINLSGKSYYAVAEPTPITILGIQAPFLRSIQPRVCYTDDRINFKVISAPYGTVVPPGGFHGHPPAGSPWTPGA